MFILQYFDWAIRCFDVYFKSLLLGCISWPLSCIQGVPQKSFFLNLPADMVSITLWVFWTILAILGNFQPFGPFWAIGDILGLLGHSGPFGPFWGLR